MNDELLDIVDQNDCIIGQMWRSKIYAQNLHNFRVVNAFLINNQEQLWIPRRTNTKSLFPLCLDASMGGHVLTGETYEDALARELMEELRINIHNIPYEYMGSLNPKKHAVSAYMKIYCIKTNKIPLYNQNDFCEYFWLSPREVINRIECGEKSKNDLALIIKYAFRKHLL